MRIGQRIFLSGKYRVILLTYFIINYLSVLIFQLHNNNLPTWRWATQKVAFRQVPIAKYIHKNKKARKIMQVGVPNDASTRPACIKETHFNVSSPPLPKLADMFMHNPRILHIPWSLIYRKRFLNIFRWCTYYIRFDFNYDSYVGAGGQVQLLFLLSSV